MIARPRSRQENFAWQNCDERLIEAALHFLRCVLFALDGRGDVGAEQGLISDTLFSHGQRGEW